MTAGVSIENAKPAADTRSERIGVLLVNLGTPDTADTKGVRVYLKEFRSDPRVIEDQGLRWKLILNGIILRVRPGRKARDYRKIWNADKDESPLKTITRAQAEKLTEAIADHDHVVVDWAMRYGNPSIRSRIDALTAQGCDRILVVPLYPQYSAATTATVSDEVFRVLADMRAQPTLRVSPPYYDDPDYIEALAVSINAHLATLPFQPELIVASFHGMPQKYVDKGDPYYAQCVATMDALRKRMGVDAAKLILTFQSRFGFDEWLQPYTDKTVVRRLWLESEANRRPPLNPFSNAMSIAGPCGWKTSLPPVTLVASVGFPSGPAIRVPVSLNTRMSGVKGFGVPGACVFWNFSSSLQILGRPCPDSSTKTSNFFALPRKATAVGAFSPLAKTDTVKPEGTMMSSPLPGSKKTFSPEQSGFVTSAMTRPGRKSSNPSARVGSSQRIRAVLAGCGIDLTPCLERAISPRSWATSDSRGPRRSSRRG